MKLFSNLFVYFLNKNVNSCLTEGTFPNDFKKAVVHSIHKNECKTINQLVFYLISLKYMKDCYMKMFVLVLINVLYASVRFSHGLSSATLPPSNH